MSSEEEIFAFLVLGNERRGSDGRVLLLPKLADEICAQGVAICKSTVPDRIQPKVVFWVMGF